MCFFQSRLSLEEGSGGSSLSLPERRAESWPPGRGGDALSLATAPGVARGPLSATAGAHLPRSGRHGSEAQGYERSKANLWGRESYCLPSLCWLLPSSPPLRAKAALLNEALLLEDAAAEARGCALLG